MSSLPTDVSVFLKGKPPVAVELFLHFYEFYLSIGALETEIETTKTTIAFGADKRYCYVYQFGKNFITGVLKINELHEDPEIFFKARPVSGTTYVHHFRLYEKKDLNARLKKYMKMALKG